MFSSVVKIRLYLDVYFCCVAVSEIQRVPLEQLMLRIRMLDIFSSNDARVGTLLTATGTCCCCSFILYLLVD